MVTITLEEYKELLLKDKPTDKDRELLKRVFDIIEPQLEYVERSYPYSNDVMKNVCINDANKVMVEIFSMLKYVDFTLYMAIWNKAMTAERNRKNQELLAEQARQAKSIRESQKEK